MARAVFNGKIIAESDSVEIVDGNVYFPPDGVRREYFRATDHETYCGWKGSARYYSIMVDGKVAENAAWTYPEPKPEAAYFGDYVAFYPVVTVER
jgi:uncharacterized protein (DUF427 family)